MAVNRESSADVSKRAIRNLGTLDSHELYQFLLKPFKEKTELSEFGEHSVVGVCYTWPAMHHQHSLTLLQRCPIHAWPLKLVPKEHVHAAENWTVMQLPRQPRGDIRDHP
mmetsp:Transcript_159819/g.291718  ORF Transcript_159819/g.291718 Transcript_159819/m.291718 type:complete len:110 (-) Transcript_159819:115-444(-)